MNGKFFGQQNIRNLSTSGQINRQTEGQIKSMQCTVSIDADTLTALIGSTVTLTAKVEPVGVHDINFKANGSIINPVPIMTDASGVATLPLDTTGKSPGLYDLTVDVLSPSVCASFPLTVALTTTSCTGVTIDTPGPITAYIGDMVSASATATVTEQSIIEFVDSVSNTRFGSCITPIPSGQCTINVDTSGAPPGTYGIVAKVGNGPSLQCTSTPISVILQETPGKIIVLSIPPGADIWYDGSNTGIKSSAIIPDVTPSVDHIISLKLSGYSDYPDQTVNLSSGETRVVFAILTTSVPPSDTGDLYVTSSPDGAEFGLYTGESGTTPMTIPGLPATVNVYEAGMTGYSMAIGSIIVKPGDTTNLNIVLQPEVVDSGLVVFESIPMGAEIYIDGLPSGAYTSYATMISPGLHTYELRLPGYVSAAGNFTVVTGTDNPAMVSVQLQSSGTSSAGAVLLLGIGILGTIVLSQSKT